MNKNNYTYIITAGNDAYSYEANIVYVSLEKEKVLEALKRIKSEYKFGELTTYIDGYDLYNIMKKKN